MALKLGLEQRLSQQLIMTPQLRQLIKLLTLSRLELEDCIQTEVENNPLLEQENPPESMVSPLEEQKVGEKEHTLNDMEDWFRYMEETSVRRPFSQAAEETYTLEPSNNPSLKEELTWQIKMSKLSDAEKEIAWVILGNVDNNGYLRLSMLELETSLGVAREVIDKVIKTIQQLDPPGIASSGLIECLLVQANIKYPKSYPLIEKILKNTLRELEAHNYKEIARKLKMREKTIMTAVDLITSLNPRPGQEFFDPNHYYIVPDAEIIEEDGEYKIILNESLESGLKINTYYRTLLRNKKKLNPEERKFLEEKYQSARMLLDGLKRRHSTLYKVLENILIVQRGFFDQGISQLAPLTLREVAEQIGVHETTVSRITSKKYVQTPRGLFSLKFFFDRGLEHQTDGEVAVKSVIERISDLIAQENTGKPLSDREIALKLHAEGVLIARRTVSKYRKQLLKVGSTQRRGRRNKINS